MKQVIHLKFTFPSLNEYIGAMNLNRHVGNNMKQAYSGDVALNARIQKIKPYNKPVEIQFIYKEKRANRDPDNIVFAKKFILDGLVSAGVLPNDTQKYIKKFTDEWVVDKFDPGVTIIIKEWEDDRGNSRKGNSRVGPLDNNRTD